MQIRTFLNRMSSRLSSLRKGIVCRLGSCFYALAGVAGWALSPMLALLAFLALPIFYAITSEGLAETRITLLRRLGDRNRENSHRAHASTGPTGE